MVKASNKQKTLLTPATWLHKEETSEMLHLKRSFVQCWNLDI